VIRMKLRSGATSAGQPNYQKMHSNFGSFWLAGSHHRLVAASGGEGLSESPRVDRRPFLNTKWPGFKPILGIDSTFWFGTDADSRPAAHYVNQ